MFLKQKNKFIYFFVVLFASTSTIPISTVPLNIKKPVTSYSKCFIFIETSLTNLILHFNFSQNNQSTSKLEQVST